MTYYFTVTNYWNDQKTCFYTSFNLNIFVIISRVKRKRCPDCITVHVDFKLFS